MTDTTLTPSTPALPDPTHLFRRAITVMLNFGQDLLGRIQGAPKLGSFDHLPKRWRHPKRAELRLTRTMDWIFALARTLSGDGLYLLPAKPPASAKPRPPRASRTKPAAPVDPPTAADLEMLRAVGRLRYMRKIFATQSTSRIARRLARRLGAKEGTDWWPEELLAITQTPAAWAARTWRAIASQPPVPTPDPPQATPTPPPPAAANTDPPERPDPRHDPPA